MNYADWYTDRVDILRVQNYKEGALTRQRRVKVAENIPCRIYRNNVHAPRTQSTAAYTESADDKLACANSVDIQLGDELHISRGKGLGHVDQRIRAIAGEPAHFYEPFGAVIPGLAHQELALLQREYLSAEVKDDEFW